MTEREKAYFHTQRYERHLEIVRESNPEISWEDALQETVKFLGGKVLTAGAVPVYKDCGCGMGEACYAWGSYPAHQAKLKTDEVTFFVNSDLFRQ